MTVLKISTAQLQQQADELAASEVLTETNEGTFGAAEACRCTGSGAAGSYRIYTRVGDGRTSLQGWDPKTAPGRARKFRDELSRKQSELRALRKQIAGR